jgi:hypothetical protein
MRRTRRYYAAVIVAGLMVLLHWNFWMEGMIHPIVLGMPILFLYHAAYLLLSVPALKFLFSTLWPDDSAEPRSHDRVS